MDGACFICFGIMRGRIVERRRAYKLNELISSYDEIRMSVMFSTGTAITLTYGIIIRKQCIQYKRNPINHHNRISSYKNEQESHFLGYLFSLTTYINRGIDPSIYCVFECLMQKALPIVAYSYAHTFC